MTGNPLPPAPWTGEQWEAITARGCSLLVPAAAGSGKTAVLVERIIRRLTDPSDPIDVDRLLVATFTEAAAAEMRDRIGRALQKGLAEDPANAHLRRQLALLGRASISTLHSFCLSLLRQHFHRLGLDPSFRVMGEHEARLLQQEVLERVFEENYGEEREAFLDLVERFGGTEADDALRGLVLRLYEHARSLPWPEQWLTEAADRFKINDDAPLETQPWFDPVRDAARRQIQRACWVIEAALAITRAPGGPLAYAENLADDLDVLQELLRVTEEGGWDDIRGTLQDLSFGRLKTIKQGTVDQVIQERVKDLRDKAKKIVAQIRDSVFVRAASDCLEDLRSLAPHMETLVGLVRRFGEEYMGAKSARAMADFGDLERFTLMLLDSGATPGELVPSEVARELRKNFVEVLVDEYQDINGVQDAIITLVSRIGDGTGDGTHDGTREDPGDSPNLFMVGDVKQSIYRFRLADPGLFIAKCKSYSPRAVGLAGDSPDTSPGLLCRRVDLRANFRSRAPVVDGVNFIFRQIMTPGVGELAYDAKAELVCSAEYPATERTASPATEVHLIEKDLQTASGLWGGDGDSAEEAPGDSRNEGSRVNGGSQANGGYQDGSSPENELDGDEQDLTALEREAALVARRIRDLVEGSSDRSGPAFSVWDKKSRSYRPLEYRDIVILLRATRGRSNVFIDVLQRSGVPAYAQVGTGYFSATEVELMLSLLAVIDNPRQDIPLAGVLRSPMVGLAAADLARIRLCVPAEDFFGALAAAGSRDDLGDLSQRVRSFLEQLETWRTAARRGPLGRLIWRIYRDTGYLSYVEGLPGGQQRYANLLALYDRARQFDQFARPGLFRFLRFIDRLRESQQDLGTAPALGENENVVRVMSIHQSKGLEFPVVFVAGLGNGFNWQDIRRDLLFQRELGLGPMVVDPEQRLQYPSLAHQAVVESIRMETLAEEIRVLYVALTRAREKLVLVGSVRNLPRQCERWSEAVEHRGWALPDAYLAEARCYLDWIGPALGRHALGEPIRSLAGIQATPADGDVLGDPSAWDIRLWRPHEILVFDGNGGIPAAGSNETESDPNAELLWSRVASLEPLDRVAPSELVEPLRQRLHWRYPFAEVAGRFAKVSVTEVKGRFGSDEEIPAQRPGSRSIGLHRRPRFLHDNPGRLISATIGTATHLALQHLDLSSALDAAEIRSQIERLVEMEALTPELAAAIDILSLVRFFASPLGLRLRAPRVLVHRELPFTMGLPVREVYPELPEAVGADGRVLIQGVVDCLLEEHDGLVIVDFKTDAVRDSAAVMEPADGWRAIGVDRETVAEAAARYQGQIRLYSRALQAIYRKPVKEAYLYFLAAGEEIRVYS